MGKEASSNGKCKNKKERGCKLTNKFKKKNPKLRRTIKIIFTIV